MAAVAASKQRAERAALADIAAVIDGALDHADSEFDGASLFGRIVGAWAAEPEEIRRRGIAFDIALIHIASMSNLMAALGWALVDLVENPRAAARVAMGGDDLALRCALESTRMAQRSIMSRAVLTDVTFDVGEMVIDVPAGWTIATLLPLLNTSAAPGLDHWDPGRWNRHRLADADALPSPMLVTAFGHGKHSCPAQSFSLSAMTAAMTHLLATYELAPGWSSHPQPVPAQIGGVARAAGPCPIHYRRR